MTSRTVFYLLLYTGLSSGVACVSDLQLFTVTETAEHTYGTFIEHPTGAKTFIGCCSLCSQEASCKSVLYHVISTVCRTSEATAPSGSLPSPGGWKYAELLSSTQTTVAPTTTLATTSTSNLATAATSNLGTPCSTNSDCSIASSKCDTSRGLCQCVAGYSFHSTLGQCVTTCTTHGTTFQPDLGKGFAGYGDVNLSGKTLEECKSACITETSMTCVVIEHKPGSLECQLYSGTALTLSSYGSYSTVNLYQRDCA